MPRPPPADEAGGLYHALNRGNLRATIFHMVAAYVAFQQIVAEGLERYNIELFSYLGRVHCSTTQFGVNTPSQRSTKT